ncbi:hypothetical protein [Microbacterium sp.]|uniref:hypothetical protein n=1 Tax=Actinomycetes TaxID=1760 RepID=UPI0037CAE506
MADPTLDELAQALAEYVDTPAAGNTYVAACAREAVAFIGQKFDRTLIVDESLEDNLEDFIIVPLEKMPRATYVREVMELGADLFFRRQAQNGIVSVNAMDGTIARVSRDPWKASEERLARWLGLGFA